MADLGEVNMHSGMLRQQDGAVEMFMHAKDDTTASSIRHNLTGSGEEGKQVKDRIKDDISTFDIQKTINCTDATPVSQLFFSPKNVDALQHGIRYRVWVETRGAKVIGRQCDKTLSTIMRGIYLEHGAYALNRGVVQQVRELNAMVLDFCVPKILTELEARMHYLHDIAHQPIPMELGVATSSKGSRQLEMNPFL